MKKLLLLSTLLLTMSFGVMANTGAPVDTPEGASHCGDELGKTPDGTTSVEEVVPAGTGVTQEGG